MSFGLPADMQVWLVLVYRYLANVGVGGSWVWLCRFWGVKLCMEYVTILLKAYQVPPSA